MGRSENIDECRGKVAVVTGATSGIGLETARKLALLQCRVIMACRDPEKGEECRADIVRDTGNENVIVSRLDLSSFESVRAFVKRVSECEERLDVLVNNAGMMHFENAPMKVDDYGLDTVLTTNHYGPFLLTILLLPMLIKATPSRIVIVSSVAYAVGEITEDVLRGKKHLPGVKSYSASKLANVMFACELAKRLEGSGVTVNSLHPGVVQTKIVRNLNMFLRVGHFLVSPLLFKSTKQGAAPVIRLAVSNDVAGVSGQYFDRFVQKTVNPVAVDQEVTKMLWKISVETTGLDKCLESNNNNNNDDSDNKLALIANVLKT